MFRKVKIIFFSTWIVAVSGPVFGIGLGEIRLSTPLNEPLRAEIQLLQIGALEKNDLLVGLAPKSDFEAAGVERLFFLTSLKFSLDLDNPKGPMVIVTTDSPVREPYLNFLLEVQWPNGRLLREYTLLMDLPTFAESQAVTRSIQGTQTSVIPPVVESSSVASLDVAALEAELAEAERGSPAPITPAVVPQASESETAIFEEDIAPGSEMTTKTPAYEAVPEPEMQAAEEFVVAEEQADVAKAATPPPAYDYQPAVPVYASSQSDEHRVVAGDNLWSIAVKYRQQTSECTSREYSCADGITIQQAMLAVQRVNPDAFVDGNINKLKKGLVLRMPSQDQVTEITSREAVAEVVRQNIAWSGDPNGRRGVAVASEQLDARVADGGVEESVQDFEDGRLKLSVPGASDGSQAGVASGAETGTIDMLQNELVIAMEELDRIKREKTGTNDQIIALTEQSKTLEKMLQVRSAELKALQAAAAVETSDAQSRADEQALEVTDAEVVSESEPAVEEVAEASVTDEAPVAEAAPATKLATSEPGILDVLMANLLYIVGAIGAVLLVVLGVVALRKRAARKDNVIEDDESSPSFVANDLTSDDNYVEQDEAMDSLEDSFDEAALGMEEEASAVPAKAETGDAIGEADIYISFGSYDKAESLLKSAIAAEPQRADLQLKLLEVYADTDNLASFDRQYSSLAALQNTGATEQAAEMRNRISGASDSPLPGASSASSSSDDLGLDLDFSASDVGDTGSNDKLDFDLDLSLDFDDAPVSETPTGASPKVSISDAPTMQQPAISMSDAPTVQQRAINISDMPTAISPAVKAAEEKTEVREELDFDLSALDSELDQIASKEFSADAVTAAIANDEPTPPNMALDEEFDFLADADEAATKLDLARAYIDMGDKDGAKDILQEVIEEGKEAQKEEARKLLQGIS